MAALPEAIAHALLAHALSLSVTAGGRTITVRGGRTGEGGPIPETPYVEIGDDYWRIEGIAAGYGLERVTARFAAIFYRAYGREVDREKEDLRELFWAFRSAIRADPTLGGLASEARVVEARSGLTVREGRPYWYWIAIVEVVSEG